MTVVYCQIVHNGERGRCEVRASIPKKSEIHKTERADGAEPQKFSSNFHPDVQPATRKMWVRSAQIAYPNRRESNATHIGNIWVAIRAGADGDPLRSANSNQCCSKSTAPSGAFGAFQDLHSKVTNAVLYLANTGAAFVTCESRPIGLSCGSGKVEASLAGKAPQSWFGALSLPAFVRPCMTLPVGLAFQRSALCRRVRKSNACRNYRSGMTSARRRGEGVGMGGCRKV